MWKTVIVESGDRLTLEKNWLVVVSPHGESRLPIEDIYSIVIDNRSASISVPVISALSENGVHILVCDNKHYPSAVILPNNTHFRPLTILRQQLTISESMKDELWQRVVKANR